MAEKILFYNSKQSNFESISNEKIIKTLKVLSSEKAEIDKSINNSSPNLTLEYFPDLLPYAKNIPNVIRLIINKIKEETEHLKKSSKNKSNSTTINNTFTHISDVSYTHTNYNKSASKTQNTTDNKAFTCAENIYIVDKSIHSVVLNLDFYDLDELNPSDSAETSGPLGTRILDFEDYRIQSTHVFIDYYYICVLTNLIMIMLANITNDRKLDKIINDILSNKSSFAEKLTEDKNILNLFENLNTTKLVKIKISNFKWDKEINIYRILLFSIFFDRIFEFTSEIEFDFAVEKIDKYFTEHNSFPQTKCELIQMGADAYKKALIANAIVSNQFFGTNVKFQSFKIIAYDSYFFEMICLKNKILKNTKCGVTYLNYIDNLEKIQTLQYFGIEFDCFDKAIFKSFNHLLLYNIQISSLSVNFFPKNINKYNFFKICLNNILEKNLFAICTKDKEKNLILNYLSNNGKDNDYLLSSSESDSKTENIMEAYTNIFNKIHSSSSANSFENFEANLFLEKNFQEYSNKFLALKNLDLSSESVVCETFFNDFAGNLNNFLIILEKRISKLKYLSLSFENVEFVNTNEKFNCLLGCFIYSLFSIVKKHEKDIDLIKFELNFGNLKFDFLKNEEVFPVVDLSEVKIYEFSLAGEIKEFYNKIIFPIDNVSILKLSRIDMKFVNKERCSILNSKRNVNKVNKGISSFNKIRKLCLEFNFALENSLFLKILKMKKQEIFSDTTRYNNITTGGSDVDDHNDKANTRVNYAKHIIENTVTERELVEIYFSYFNITYGKFYLDKGNHGISNQLDHEEKSKFNGIINKIYASERLKDFFNNIKAFEKHGNNNILYDFNYMEFTNFHELLKLYLLANKDKAEDFQIFILILNIIDNEGINLILLLNMIYLYDIKKVQYRIKLRFINIENFMRLSDEQDFYIITFDYKNKKVLELKMNQKIMPYELKKGLFLIEKYKINKRNLNLGDFQGSKNYKISKISKKIKEFVQENYIRNIEVYY